MKERQVGKQFIKERQEYLRLERATYQKSNLTKERQGRKKSVLLPSSKQIISGAERVDTLRVLGVTLNQQLNMSYHIDRTLSPCASSQFA